MFKQKHVLVIPIVLIMLVVAICGAYCAPMLSQNGHSCCPTSQSSNCGMDHSTDDRLSGPVPAVELIKIEKTYRIDFSYIIYPQMKHSFTVEKVTIYSPPGQLIAIAAPLNHQFKGSKDFI